MVTNIGITLRARGDGSSTPGMMRQCAWRINRASALCQIRLDLPVRLFHWINFAWVLVFAGIGTERLAVSGRSIDND